MSVWDFFVSAGSADPYINQHFRSPYILYSISVQVVCDQIKQICYGTPIANNIFLGSLEFFAEVIYGITETSYSIRDRRSACRRNYVHLL